MNKKQMLYVFFLTIVMCVATAAVISVVGRVSFFDALYVSGVLVGFAAAWMVSVVVIGLIYQALGD